MSPHLRAAWDAARDFFNNGPTRAELARQEAIMTSLDTLFRETRAAVARTEELKLSARSAHGLAIVEAAGVLSVRQAEERHLARLAEIERKYPR